MKRKQSLFLLLGLLACSIVALIMLNQEKDTQAPEETISTGLQDTEALIVFDKEQIQSITLEDSAGSSTFLVEDNGWLIQDADEIDYNLNTLTSQLNGLLYIDSYGTLEDVDLADFGLKTPEYKVTYTLNDGSSMTMAVGILTPDGTKAYAMLEDNPDTVHLISAYTSRRVDSDLSQFRDVSFNPVDPQTMYSLSASGRDFETLSIIYSDTSSNLTPFTMVAPVTSPLSLQNERLTELFEAIPTPYVDTYVADNVEDFSAYGFDTPILDLTYEVVNPYDPSQISTYHFLWGDYFDEEMIYFKEAEHDSVYAMNRSSVDNFISHLDIYNLSERLFGIVNITQVEALDIQINDETYTLSITRTEDPEAEVTEDGKKVFIESYFVEDIEIKEEDFKRLYRLAIGITSDTDLTSYETDLETTPAATLTYHFLDGSTTIYEFFNYDDLFYAHKLDEKLIVGCNIKQFDYLAEELAAWSGQ